MALLLTREAGSGGKPSFPSTKRQLRCSRHKGNQRVFYEERYLSQAERKIGRNHLAFFRAYLQGLDARRMWERYMGGYGVAELTTVRSTLYWLRTEFIAAARRAGEPRLAVLLKRDPNLMPASDAPAMDAFAARYPPGFYTQTELDVLYGEEFGGGGSATRRARLRERQLEALFWVESHLVSQPRDQDRCDAWLDERVARRLSLAGILTFAQLLTFINERGYRWWMQVERLGEKGALRVVRFLQENAAEIGVALLPHATTKRRELVVASVASTLPKRTAIVPMERLLIPAELNGANGRYRGERAGCMMDAGNDYEAIEAWLATKRDTNTTRRNCRKEAERFLLWAVVQKRKPLSSMSLEDCTEYREFLAKPEPTERWCAPRGGQRWTNAWRPFEGALSGRSQRQAITILKSLFAWLTVEGYLMGNAWNGVPAPAAPPPQKYTGRSLTKRQWAAILTFVRALPNTGAARRIQFLLRFAYATGLRLSELANAKTLHLHRVAVDDEDTEAWMLDVVGKGQKEREVPMPDSLMVALSDYLVLRGLNADPRECAPDTPLIGKLAPSTTPDNGDTAEQLTPGRIYKILDDVFKRAAQSIENASPEDAARLRQASTHWLRHTHGTHAVADKVPLDVLQYNLGHSSLNTTSIYVTAERSRRIKEMRRLSLGQEPTGT